VVGSIGYRKWFCVVSGYFTFYASHYTFSNPIPSPRFSNTKIVLQKVAGFRTSNGVLSQDRSGIELAKDFCGVTLAVKSHPEASVETELPISLAARVVSSRR